MRVLLDTAALVELRNRRGDPAVKAAVACIPEDHIFLSVLIVAEIARGIALLPNGRKKQALTEWLIVLENRFADRILAVDCETAHLWGDILARAKRGGVSLLPVEALLAATALRHGLYVMTQNTERFAVTGALILDPWQTSKSVGQA